jgi:hypothetical protein
MIITSPSQNLPKVPRWYLITIEHKYEQQMKSILGNICRKRKKVYRSIKYHTNVVDFTVKIKSSELMLMKLSFPLQHFKL